jgi:hypothetical protein
MGLVRLGRIAERVQSLSEVFTVDAFQAPQPPLEELG